MIITDHHDIQTNEETGEDLMPPADVIVNPKRRTAGIRGRRSAEPWWPLSLFGALYEAYGISRKEWLELLELAAIATVGDVMKLKDENRIVVKEGLKRLAVTGNPALKA